MRILVLTHRLPYAPDRGDRLRVYHMLRHLTARADIELVSLVHDDDEAAHVEDVRRFVPRVTALRVPRWRTRARALAALPTRMPLTHALLDSPAAAGVFEDICTRRRPDVVFAQLGIDTHFRDPLTHLQLTTQGFTEAVRKLHALGQEAGVFVAVGGGGYDMGAVARAWTMAMAELAGFELPKRVPESYDAVNGLTTFADDPGPAPLPADTAEQVEEYAEGTI